MHGCTITTAHYRAHARVLAESFLAANPGASFSVLMIDDSPERPSAPEPFQTLAPADIGIDRAELQRRTTMYITQGMSVSMKPDLLLALLDCGHETVVFVDADGFVYDSLDLLAELAREHSLVLSPHSNDPYPLWEVDSPEQTFIRAGTINAGLMAVSGQARPFLRWWAQRTARRCVFDPPRGLFLEQTWLMLAPSLFEHHILRERGLNVAGWNIHDRDVQWQGERPTIDGVPLRHFHYAMSYDPEHPERLTASEHARWWPSLEQRPGVARLSREYAERLLAAGFRQARQAPPLFDAMPDGAPIEPWMRAAYREALIHAELNDEPEPPNPFAHGQERFLEWLQPRAVERLAGARVGEAGTGSGGAFDGEPFSAQEMAEAMMDTAKLLERIRELERIRDDAVAWAERVSGELKLAGEAIDERNRQLAEQQGVLEEVWNSLSWRVTRPLRTVKEKAARRSGGSS